jgi:hypothetical protein
MFSIHMANFAELNSEGSSSPAIIATMEGLQEQLAAAGASYSWIPRGCLPALVQLLAANILKPSGKVKAALAHVGRGELLTAECPGQGIRGLLKCCLRNLTRIDVRIVMLMSAKRLL